MPGLPGVKVTFRNSPSVPVGTDTTTRALFSLIAISSLSMRYLAFTTWTASSTASAITLSGTPAWLSSRLTTVTAVFLR